MRIRYDRLAVIQDAWNTLAACVICFRLLHDDDSLSREVLAELLRCQMWGRGHTDTISGTGCTRELTAVGHP